MNKKKTALLLALALLFALLTACGQQAAQPQQSAAQQPDRLTPGEAAGQPPAPSSRPAASAGGRAPRATPPAEASSAPAGQRPDPSETPAPPPHEGGEEESPAFDPAEVLSVEAGSGGTTYRFTALPQTAEELTALWEAQPSAPEYTAALCIAAFCRYPASREDCNAMIDLLRGPNPMAEADRQFIADRFRDKDYVPRSYFAGAVPDNDYTPDEPFTLTITADAHSFDTENTARLFVSSGGADSPRPITLRLAKDGKWYLWEYSSLLLDIRPAAADNPWA